MGLETGSFIDDLVSTNPVSASDLVRYGAGHLRIIKELLKNSFAGSGGAILVAGADLSATANLITLTPVPALTEYTTRMLVVWLQAVSNTGATTINISSLGAKAIVSVGNAALASGDLVAGRVYVGIYDGTSVQLQAVTKNYVDQLAFNSALPAQSLGLLISTGAVASFSQTLTGFALNEVKGADIVCSAALNLTTATGNLVHVTGSTGPITAITMPAGAERAVVFDSTPTLTAGASLILMGATSIKVSAGDIMLFRGDSAGVVYLEAYSGGKNGQSIITSTQSFTVPANISWLEIEALGGGGGGGGGCGNAAGNARPGGTAGGGGARTKIRLVGSQIPAAGTSITCTIGAGGVGGAGGVTANGSNGTAGGNTSFGTYLTAYGGGAGAGGVAGTNVSAGAGGGSGGAGANGGTSSALGGLPAVAAFYGGTTSGSQNNTGNGGAASLNSSVTSGCAEYGGAGGGYSDGTGTGGNQGGGSLYAGAAGGPGGGISAANAGNQAGAAGRSGFYAAGGGAAAGASGASGSVGAAGTDGSGSVGGGGGGGGGYGTSGTGGAGGAGGTCGGGGGGGGAGTSTGGAGGAGGRGEIRTSWG